MVCVCVYIPILMISSAISYTITVHVLITHTPFPSISNKHQQTMNSSDQTTIMSTATTNLSFPQFIKEIRGFELFIAVAIFVIIRSLRQQKHQGLAVWPVVGMLPSLALGLRHDVYDWATQVMRRQNFTFTFKGPIFTNLHCVVTADPRNIEHILKTKFSSFPKGDYFRYTARDLLGKGIFNADDEEWRRQRKVASIELHSAAFRALTARSLVELVHGRLLPVLEEFCQRQRSVDLQDVLLRLTFDNVAMIAFGADPGCLRPGLPEIPFARDFENATSATVIRFIVPTAIWKAMRFLKVGHERTLIESLKGVDEFAYGVIEARKKDLAEIKTANRVNNNSSLAKERSDILSVFMGLRDEDGSPFSDKFLRDICVNFMLAGRDTSSVAMTWFFWLVDQNPVVEEKIMAELRGIVSAREDDEDDRVEIHPLVFRPEEVKNMHYLQAALSEALRLYPSVPVDHKEVIEDEVFPDGTVMKKGTKVLYLIYTMGRMESLWGEDCRDFKPERWLQDGRFTTESAYKFTAFNGGPRLCLGKEFAYYQMRFTAASILYRYRVRVVKNHVVTPKLALTMYMKHGLKVKMEKRETRN